MQRFFFLILLTVTVWFLFSCSETQDKIIIEEVVYKNTAHYKIMTANAVYYYEKESGGFSSIFDKNKTDWIQFHKSDSVRVPESAASDFRGLPNLVYRGKQNGIGHPGFDKCISKKQNDSTIITQSKSRKYKYTWTFRNNCATMQLLKADTSRNYWFLYEGTIAGKFSPKTHLCFTNAGFQPEKPNIFDGNPIKGSFQWVCFGDEQYDKLFYVKHNSPDKLKDIITYMGASANKNQSDDGMVVAGFGRNEKSEPLMQTVPNSFTIGFLTKQSENNQEIYKMVNQKIGNSINCF